MMILKSSNAKSILAILFVISGAAGLIYQVVWFKYLALFVGNTTYAQMIVLATFLGGIAAGNFFIGTHADNFKNPVRIYSLLEIIIGIYCLAYPLLNALLGKGFYSLVLQTDLESQSFVFTFLRFILSASLLFIPTFIMGGTLPVLSKFFVDNLNFARRDTAILYFLNSFGAVGGTLFAGFYLIKSFGLDTTIYISAFINIMIGIIGVVVSFLLPKSSVRNDILVTINDEKIIEEEKYILLSVIVIAGTSGFAAFLYEMVWTRLLVNILGSSTYAFSVMLMAFISGITLGSFIVSLKFFSRFNKVKLIAFCQAAIAIATMLVLPFYERLPYYFWTISSYLQKTESTFTIFLTIEFVLCFLIIFLPTIFSGMTLPIAVEIISQSSNKISFSVGRIFSVNTLGTVVGTIITGLVFIPVFGIKTTFEIGVLINLFSAIFLILIYKKIKISFRLTLGLILFLVYFLYILIVPEWNHNALTSGVFRKIHEAPPSSYKEFIHKFASDRKILFYEEGISATVAVYERNDSLHQRILIVNGKPDASSYLDMPTQVLLGQIPMMLHPDPKKVFVIGVGSGVTIGSVLTHPVENVTAVEISPEVVRASNYFNSWNNNYLKDKRLKVVVEDAHTYLKLTNEKYDVIISEPSNPWIAGIGNLFSTEYFERCKEKLNKEGILLQWFHIYEQNDEIVKLVFSTFSKVFPNAQLWISMFGDVMMVGSEKEIELNAELLNQKFNKPEIKNDFKKIDINSVFEFLSCQAFTEEGFYSIAESNLTNTEKHPVLEFIAPKSFYLEQTSKLVYQYDERFNPIATNLLAAKYLKLSKPSNEQIYSAAIYQFDRAKNQRLAYAFTKYLLINNPNDYKVNTLNLDCADQINLHNSRSFQLEKIMNLYPDSPKVVYEYANEKIREQIISTSFLYTSPVDFYLKIIKKVAKKDTVSYAKMIIQFAGILLQNGEVEKADSLCKIVDNILTANNNVGKYIPADDYAYVYSTTNMLKPDFRKAIEYAMALNAINPKHINKNILLRKLKWRLR